MPKHNAKNERIKRDYFQYLREAKRQAPQSVDAAAAALARFEVSNGCKEFGKFHRAQAVAFKRKLDEQNALHSGARLSRATVNAILRQLRAFFIWLAMQPGYKTKISYSDADYFNLSDNDVRIANAKRERPVPSLEQMHHTLTRMPTATSIELRDRALVALAMLTGARDAALVSLQLKHIDCAECVIRQDACEVRTKFRKTFSTWFFPIGGEAEAIIADWVAHLRQDLLRGESDPLFPATAMGLSADGEFMVQGLARQGWSTTAPVREIFKRALTRVSLPYFQPHSMRHMLARHGQQICQTPEQYKAWSQNLGHDHVLTTFTSYGTVPSHRQAELIRGMGAGCSNVHDQLDDPDVIALIDRITARRGSR